MKQTFQGLEYTFHNMECLFHDAESPLALSSENE